MCGSPNTPPNIPSWKRSPRHNNPGGGLYHFPLRSSVWWITGLARVPESSTKLPYSVTGVLEFFSIIPLAVLFPGGSNLPICTFSTSVPIRRVCVQCGFHSAARPECISSSWSVKKVFIEYQVSHASEPNIKGSGDQWSDDCAGGEAESINNRKIGAKYFYAP